MFFARGIIDAKPSAKRIKRGWRARKLAPRDGQCVDRLIRRKLFHSGPAQFGIQEFHVKTSVVNDKLGVSNEFEERLPDCS